MSTATAKAVVGTAAPLPGPRRPQGDAPGVAHVFVDDLRMILLLVSHEIGLGVAEILTQFLGGSRDGSH